MNCDPAEYQGLAAKFMIDCLALIEGQLPLSTSQGLLACRRYLTGKGSMEAIKRAILDCWRAEREWRREHPFDITDMSANRAILCILKDLEGDESDLVDLLSFFLNMANKVEAHKEEQGALLKERFAACL